MQLKPGTTLQGGKYEVVRTLGQSGFSITYEAAQISLNRKVTIKEFFMKDVCIRDMKTSCVSISSVANKNAWESFKGKFVREAKTLAAFDHTHIVRVIDVFEENGTVYYVMNNLQGGSLDDKVKKEGYLLEEQAEKYIRQVANAMAYIHERDTVHLDINPSNILLDENGEAILIGLGVSKHCDQADKLEGNMPIGFSKGYTPLELGRDGEVSQFNPSTDIYALGATLYHLISGVVPPEASIVNEDGLDRPKGVSDRIWNAIYKAMQPKRKDRPQNIAEFLQLLDQKEDNVTVVTRTDESNVDIKEDSQENSGERANRELSKTLSWVLLATIAVEAIVLALVLGKKDVKPKLPVLAKDTVTTAVISIPKEQVDEVIHVTGVKLSALSLELEEGQSATLVATITPNNATDKTVSWKSYDEKVVTVSENGKLMARKVGLSTIIARCGNHESCCDVTVKKKNAPIRRLSAQQQSQQQSISVRTGYDNGHEWVDLGLPSGTKWATCNVGALSPTENGDYFAWGETSTKSDYTWESYRFRKSGEKIENVCFSKYNLGGGNEASNQGEVDNKSQLDPSDDAACVNWGGKWHIPTRAQWQELKENCSWSWTGKAYNVAGPNKQSITLPAAGVKQGDFVYDLTIDGYYWSSSLEWGPFACNMHFYSMGGKNTKSGYRYRGYSIRPVIE